MENNIVLKDVRRVHTFELPSFPKSKVELYDGLLFGQLKELGQAPSDFDRGTQSLLLLIKSWNFVGGDDKPLPITSENLNQLPAKDLTFLLEQVADFFTDKEKKVKKT